MSTHHSGFSIQRLAEQPNGYPAKGYEFEFAWPAVGPHSTAFGCVHIDTFRVTGWEKQIDAEGNERVSVRVWPIARRTRRPKGVSWKICDLEHVHEVFEYNDVSPLKGETPEVWGTGE